MGFAPMEMGRNIHSVALKNARAGRFTRAPTSVRTGERLDIIGIAIGGVIGGAESWPTVAEYGRAKQAWLAQ